MALEYTVRGCFLVYVSCFPWYDYSRFGNLLPGDVHRHPRPPLPGAVHGFCSIMYVKQTLEKVL